MKKIFSILGMLSFTAMFYAQVGIHTDAPNATLDVRESSVFSASVPQGVSFPNFTTEERATFVGVQKGTMIYNTTKRCLELYGVNNGVTDWYCICDTCEVAAVTEDDAVVDAIKGIEKSVGKTVNGMVDGVDNADFFVDEGCYGYAPAYYVLETGVSTPIVYTAHSAGKRVEQRYTKEFVSYYYDKSTGQLTDRVMDRKNITLVIPAGDFEEGTDKQIIDAYVEIDGNGEFMYTNDDAELQTIYWDVEIGGLKAKVALRLWTDVQFWSCE